MVANNAIDFFQLDDIAAALEPTLRYAMMVSTFGSVMDHVGIASLVKHCEAILNQDDFVSFVELSRRAIIKTIAMVGSARAHYAMIILMQAVSEDVKAKLSKDVYRTEEEQDYKLVSKRGQDFARRVFEDHADAILKDNTDMCPELLPVFFFDAYGRFICSEGIMPLKESELCILAAVIPLQIEDYINIHIKGSAVYGANKDEINAAMAVGDLVLKGGA
ncbi:hypothetical protein EC988_004263 [Linderina pennispora]|nr:hypothetical protein EC988_004263 [Linderina pennispora]